MFTDEKEQRRVAYFRNKAIEAEKRRLLDEEARNIEARYFRELARGNFTRTTGDEREPWLQ
jgi:hypothetical protein